MGTSVSERIRRSGFGRTFRRLNTHVFILDQLDIGGEVCLKIKYLITNKQLAYFAFCTEYKLARIKESVLLKNCDLREWLRRYFMPCSDRIILNEDTKV